MPRFGDHIDVSTNWFRTAQLEHAMDGGPPVIHGRRTGILTCTPKELTAKIVELTGVRPVQIVPGSVPDAGQTIFVSSDAMLSINVWAINEKMFTGDVNFSTQDRTVFDKLFEALTPLLIPPSVEGGPVYALTKNGDDYSTSRIGTAGSPIERGNYNKLVLGEYDHILEDLKSTNPCGRLIIFSGEAGTGKTFLVKGILNSIPSATFLLVPPHLMKRLGDPELVEVLADAKQGKGPLVILAEDADDCLVARQEGEDEEVSRRTSLESIQAVLNLGDGILGNLLDVRVIITTNAASIKMDKAAIRPGRLCKHVHVDALSRAEAQAAMVRLVGDEASKATFDLNQGITLAMVYAAARTLGWAAPAQPESTDEDPPDSYRD